MESSIQNILKSPKIARLANHTTLVALLPFRYPFCCQTAPRSTWQQPASHGSSKFRTLSQYQFYQSFIWKSTKSNPNRPKRPLVSHCSKHLQPLRQTQPPSLPCLRKRGVQPHGMGFTGGEPSSSTRLPSERSKNMSSDTLIHSGCNRMGESGSLFNQNFTCQRNCSLNSVSHK